jgi:hypothetical protein
MIYKEPIWYFEEYAGMLKHFKGGEIEPCKYIPDEMFDVIMPTHYIPELVAFLTEKGYIKPTMSNQSREEDLKIVHRLLDLCEKKID